MVQNSIPEASDRKTEECVEKILYSKKEKLVVELRTILPGSQVLKLLSN